MRDHLQPPRERDRSPTEGSHFLSADDTDCRRLESACRSISISYLWTSAKSADKKREQRAAMSDETS
jgi:hypothetical protein